MQPKPEPTTNPTNPAFTDQAAYRLNWEPLRCEYESQKGELWLTLPRLHARSLRVPVALRWYYCVLARDTKSPQDLWGAVKHAGDFGQLYANRMQDAMNAETTLDAAGNTWLPKDAPAFIAWHVFQTIQHLMLGITSTEEDRQAPQLWQQFTRQCYDYLNRTAQDPSPDYFLKHPPS